jgi:hypothetical protein
MALGGLTRQQRVVNLDVATASIVQDLELSTVSSGNVIEVLLIIGIHILAVRMLALKSIVSARNHTLCVLGPTVTQVEPLRSGQSHLDVLDLLRSDELLHLLELGQVSGLDMLDLASAKSRRSRLGVHGHEGTDVGNIQLKGCVSHQNLAFLEAIELTLKISRGGWSTSAGH